MRRIGACGGSWAVIGLLCCAVGTLQCAQLPVHAYTTADGLPSNIVNRIVQDSRGFLWFCTREGLSRFDGYQFTNFGVDQALPDRDQDLLETQTGEYWVATGDGVARFNPAASPKLFTIYRPEDRKAREVLVLKEDGGGGIWCGTRGGLYHLARAEPNSRSPESGFWRLRFVDIGMPKATWDDTTIEALLRDRTGTLWAGGPSGLYQRLLNGCWRRYSTQNGLPSNHVLALLEDRQGRFWAGTWQGLCRISMRRSAAELSVEKVYTMKNGLPGEVIEGLFESSDGQLWIATNGGLSKYLPQKGREEFENYSTAQGLNSDEITAVMEDRAGNLWLGAQGVNKISRGGFVTYGKQDGLASNWVVAMFEDRKGELCALSKEADGKPAVREPVRWPAVPFRVAQHSEADRLLGLGFEPDYVSRSHR